MLVRWFILIKDHLKLDFEMIYYNSDGLLSSMCGNGLDVQWLLLIKKYLFKKHMAYDGPTKVL